MKQNKKQHCKLKTVSVNETQVRSSVEESKPDYPRSQSLTNSKSLRLQCVAAIPSDPNYSEEVFDIVIKDLIKKFHGMSTHLPNLPDEFALAVSVIDEKTNSAETVKMVWMKATPDSAYLPELKRSVDFYDLEVVDVFSSGDFEEVITIIDGKEIKTGEVKIKEKLFN